MSGFTEKRMKQLRELVSEYVKSDEQVDELMGRIGKELGVAEELEKRREKRRAYSEKERASTGGSTYTASDRAYYEKNREELNKRKTELRRRQREASRAAPAASVGPEIKST